MAACGTGTAYAIDIVIIQRVFYGQDFGFLANLLLILTTQMVGYAYIFPALAALTVLCWIRPTSIILSQITGSNGLGVGVISLDWNTIRAFLGSPLVTPWWAQANIIVGFVLTTWVLVPIAYYTNLWNAQLYPIMNAKLYTTTGELYDTMSILTPQRTLDIAKYTDYGPLRITTFFALGYGVGFATLTAILTHTLLYQRKQIWTTWKLSRGKADTSSDGAVGGRPAEVFDIHYRLMQAYREVPEWWYIALFVLMAVLSVLTCEVWDYGLPWWCVILSLAISIVFALPIGLIQAVTNMQPGLNIITEFVVGYILPGRPIANVVFKTYGYITMSHALIFVGDLKLGQYMKIAPRAMFWTQMMGTIIAGIVNLVTANWLLSTRPNVCTPEGSPWGCPGPNVFYSASVIWGVIAPDRMFGPTSIYHPVMYFFLLGAFLPVPFYFLGRLFPSNRYPILGSLISKIHIPVMLSGLGVMPPARGFHFTNWAAVGFIFQYWIRKYHRAWHQRFNYLTSAALDSGVALSALVIFFSLQMHDIQFPAWWGTTQVADRQCPLDKANFAGVIVAKKH
ncbi:hypothetical protein BGZ73_005825 [Actinomortierella ambigua]|nr:hypothetical protein BGZ73_005825 [Actinomortierella ambigua]